MRTSFAIAGKPHAVPLQDIERFLKAIDRASQSGRQTCFAASNGARVIVRDTLADVPISDALNYLHDCIHGVVRIAGDAR